MNIWTSRSAKKTAIATSPKILLLRFSAIGDIVLTSPVARCLSEQLNAEVHVLTKAQYAQIPAALPSVQRVFAFGKGEIDEKTTIKPNLPDLFSLLRAEQYDWVIDLHHNLRSLRVKWALGRPSRAFQKLNFEKWLLVNLKINRLPNRHIVDRYLDTVAHLGIKNDGKGLGFPINAAKRAEHASSVSKLLQPLGGQPFVAFVIGATHATKRLPEHKIIEIVRETKWPIVLIGGPDEREVGERVAAATGAIHACGLLNLWGSAMLVEQAQLVVTHDTGMMHIAAALGKPIVAIWGNTVPDFGMYPYLPTEAPVHRNVEVFDLPCRPCSKIGHEACPKGHFGCMEGIKASQVWEK